MGKRGRGPRPEFAALLALLLVGSVWGGASDAAPKAYYVSGQGSDANPGTAQNPWRTISRATSTAPADALIKVGAGIYRPFAVTRSGQTVTGTAGMDVIIRGQVGVRDVVRISASQVTLRDVVVEGCVPDSDPVGGFGDGGSSGVRIGDDTVGVTVQGLTVRRSRGVNDSGRSFGCFGVLAHHASDVSILDNNIWGNGQGIYVIGGGGGALISGNEVHDNTVLIRNTPGGNDDFGAGAIAFVDLDAAKPSVASRNIIYGNAGSSADYGTDGGAFEIYNASRVKITENTIYDNENIVETGTSNRLGCSDNTFTDNQASGRKAGSSLTHSIGLLLRCATRMVVRGNTFAGIDRFVFAIDDSDFFAGGVDGLTITGNRITNPSNVYYLNVDPKTVRLSIDRNRFRMSSAPFAYYGDGSATSHRLANWQARTGLDSNSTRY